MNDRLFNAFVRSFPRPLVVRLTRRSRNHTNPTRKFWYCAFPRETKSKSFIDKRLEHSEVDHLVWSRSRKCRSNTSTKRERVSRFFSECTHSLALRTCMTDLFAYVITIPKETEKRDAKRRKRGSYDNRMKNLD